MFEPIAAAASPERNRLAGPVSALAHGVAFASILAIGWWKAPDPDWPEIADRNIVYRVALEPRADNSPRQGSGPRGGKPRTLRTESFPTRVPADPRPALDDRPTSLVASDSLDDPSNTTDGLGGDKPGSSGCPGCTGEGDQAIPGDPVYPPGGNVLSPLLVWRIEPFYPEAMRKGRQEGTVVLAAIIGKDGTIEEATVESATNPLFEAEALKAIRQWRYRPGTLNGQPVRVLLRVFVTFRMH